MSTSSISWTADATARYERLAAEYSKLRSNANVLKNGVLEERAKSQKLSDSLQNSETQLRKAQAENESLSFRNEQLTKRVLSLQEELESSNKKDGKKEKSSKRENFSAAMEADLKNRVQLLEEELQNKMNENMNLIEKINELELLHSKEIMEISEKFAAQINRLEGQLEEVRHLNVENEKKLAKTAETREIETAVVVPFTLHDQFKNNNEDPLLKVDLNAHAPPRSEAYRLCCESGRLCSSAISTFLHLYSERTTLFPYDSSLEQLPQEIQQLSANLSEASTKAHEMAMFLQDLLEREQFDLEIELISFLNHFSPFCASLNVLKPGFSALLNAETRGTWSTSHLERLSHQFTDHVQKLTEKFGDLLHELQNRSFSQNLVSKLHQLANTIKDLKDSYCTRWRVESQLPIATKKLKCVGGALTNCLNQLSLEAGRFGARFEKALLITDESIATSIGVSPLHKIVEIPGIPFDQPTTSATDAQDDDIEESRLEVNEEVKEIKSFEVPTKSPKNCSEEISASLITLETACEKQRTRITELETEREQLLVEIALLKRKAERAQKEKDEKTTENISNQMETINSNDDQNDVAVVKHFYSERLSETFTHLQIERDRAKHLTAECSSLLRRATVAEDERRLLEERMKALNKQKQQVEEELSTVRRGYEEQMGELTAHVAELNTKMGLNGQQQGTDRTQQNGSTNSTPRSSFARKLLFQK